MSERERERGNAIPILEPTCHPLIHARQHPRTLRRIMSPVLGVLAMPDLVAELAEQACGLPAEDRSRLVDLLLESLHDSPLAEVEAAWAREIERRVAAHARGEVETYAAEDVFAEARRIAQ